MIRWFLALVLSSWCSLGATITITNVPVAGGISTNDTLLGVTNNNYSARISIGQILSLIPVSVAGQTNFSYVVITNSPWQWASANLTNWSLLSTNIIGMGGATNVFQSSTTNNSGIVISTNGYLYVISIAPTQTFTDVTIGTVYATNFSGSIYGTNIAAGTINSNKFDAPTLALIGLGSGLLSLNNVWTGSNYYSGPVVISNVGQTNIFGSAVFTGSIIGDGSGLTNISGTGGSTNLTPWTTDINGNGKSLTNVHSIQVTNSITVGDSSKTNTFGHTVFNQTVTGLTNYSQLNGTNLFTRTNTFEADALGTTITPIMWLTNATAAALGAQQVSPALMMGGQGWHSGNSTTMPVQMGWYVLPVEGSSANPLARLMFIRSISNATPSALVSDSYITSNGGLVVGTVQAAGEITAGASSWIYWSGRTLMGSSVNGDLQLVNTTATGFNKLNFGPTTSNWPAIKVETSTNNPSISFRTGNDSNYVSIVASNITATAGIFVNGNGTNVFGTTIITNLTLAMPVWRDMIGDASTLSKGGTAVTRGELFPGSVVTAEEWPIDAYGDGVVQFNHDLATTNSLFPNLYIVPHIHCSVTNIPANTSNITYTLKYYWCPIGTAWTSAVTGTLTNVVAVTAVNMHSLLSFTPITNNAAAGTVSSLLRYRITRITSASDDVGSAGGGQVRIGDFDIHYPVNRFGSSGPATY